MKTETLAERTKRVLDKTASIDAREQAIIDRHTSTAPSDGLASRTAKAMAQLEIESRRQQRSYAEQAPTETVEPVKEMLSNIGDRAAMLAAVRKLTPEQRAEALKLKPGVAQIMGDDRGGAGNRTLGAVSRGISGVSQPIQELVSGIAEQPIVKSLGGLVAGRAISQPATEMLGNVSGTAEEIEFIRQFEAASQEFAPARPDDPWYARGPLQATEMAPWMVTTVGGAGLGRAAATGVAGRIAARGAAGGKIAQGVAKAGQAVGKVITAGKAGELTGITAAAFPSQYAQEVDQLKAIGMEDGTQLRLLAGATSAVIGLWEGIVPNPYGAKVPLKEGAVKAARQYLWEAAKRAPGELSEEYLQGVTSGLGEHVAQYIDENAEDKTVADAFRKGWEQTKEAALPMAFLLGVPAVGGAGRAALQARATQPPVGTPPTEQAPPTDVNTRGEQPLAVQAVMQSFIDGAMQKLATLDKPPGAHKWAEIVLGDRKRFKEAPDEATRTKLWQQSRGTATEAPTPPTLPPSLPQGDPYASQVPTNEGTTDNGASIPSEYDSLFNSDGNPLGWRFTRTFAEANGLGHLGVSELQKSVMNGSPITIEQAKALEEASVSQQRADYEAWKEQQNKENEEAKSNPRQKETRTRKNYLVRTEDDGEIDAFILRSSDGSAAIFFGDWQPIDYKAAYAKDKSDEELLSHSLELRGYQGAKQQPQGATDVSQVPTNEEVQGQARIQGEQETRVQGSEQATQENAGTEVPVKQGVEPTEIKIGTTVNTVRNGKDQQAVVVDISGDDIKLEGDGKRTWWTNKVNASPGTDASQVEKPKQVQGEIADNQLRIFKDGKWRNATVTAVNEGDAGWRVKHVKVADPETGRYEYVPFPSDAAKGYDSYEQAREDVFSVLKEKYKEPPAISAKPQFNPTTGEDDTAAVASKRPKDIPPLKPGFARVVHIGKPGDEESLKGGLDYSKYGMLQSTARSWADESQVEYDSKDPRFAGGTAYVFDVPESEMRKHGIPQVSPGKLPGEYYVGSVTPASKPTVDPVSELDQAEDELAGLLGDEEKPAPVEQPQKPAKPAGDIVAGSGGGHSLDAKGKFYREDPNPDLKPSERLKTRQEVDTSEGVVLVTKDQWGKPIPPETMKARQEFVDKAKPGTEFEHKDYKGQTFKVQDDGSLLNSSGRRMNNAQEMANTVEPGVIIWKETKAEASQPAKSPELTPPAKLGRKGATKKPSPEPTGEQDTGTNRGQTGEQVGNKPADTTQASADQVNVDSGEESKVKTETTDADIDAMMRSLADEMDDAPKPEKKKPLPAKPRKYESPKKSEKTQATAAEKRKQASQALRDSLKGLDGSSPTSGLNLKVGLEVLKAVKLYIEADILDFKSFIESVVEDLGEAWIKGKERYLESAWRTANDKGWVDSPAGKVADILPAAEPTKQPAKASQPKAEETDVDKTLRQAGLKVEQLPDGRWQITGNTYEHSKEIGDVKREISELGGWWDRDKKRWTFKRDPRRAISDRLAGKGTGEESRNEASRDEQVAREDARREQEARPDAQRPSEDYVANVDQSTKDLIARGLKYGMTQEVVDNQIEDIGMVVDAAENDRKMFVIGSAPGTGKTFVLGGVIRELRSRGFDKFIYVTQNQNLISQVQGNLADYGLEGVEFTTYTKSRSTPPSTTGAVLLLDEAHSAKNIDLATGKSVSSMVSGSRFTVYATATPFENVTEADYLASSGIFDGIHVEFERPSNRPGKPFRNTLDGFDAWAWMFGAKVYFVKNRNGDLVPVVWWDKHQTAEEDQFAANEWLKKRGVYVQRPMSLPAGTVNSELRGIDADPYWADISNEVVQIYADAESEAENNVERGQINAHKVNVLKRLLEAAKVDAAIARAKELIGEGKKDDPQVIIFVNTKVETNLGSFTLSEPYRKERGIKGDQAKRRYKPAEMDKMMQSWYEAKAAAKRMGEDAGPPPFAPFIHKIAMAMDRAGVLEKFPSVIDKIIEQFPGQAVEFSGRTPSKNAENLAKWKNNEAKLIVATMDKGGTGLSFHDTTGKMPSRYQVNMNLPWSGTKVEQVSGRLARYGTAKPVNLEWIFANNIPFDRELSRTVGSRMRSMSAAVQGRKSGEAKQIRDFDFEDLQSEDQQPQDRLQQIQDTFPINREQAIVADILFDVTAIPGEVEIALPGTPIPGDALTQSEIPLTIARNLTPEELDGLRADVVKDIVAHFESLPPDTDFEEASKAGIAKRGWYKRAAESLSQLFGEDAERFVTLLAATSPRQGVTENLKMTLTIWKAWNEAGRPVSRREITKVLKPIPGALFGSRRPNTIRSLQGQRKLSGYKVNSFAQNLLGNFEEVTNDAWMAAFAGIDQKIFGTKAGYLAFSAKMRKTAKKLGMTPAEVQETIWSFVKTLSALRTGGRTSKEALAGMTHESVAAMPEFTELIVGNKDVKKLLGQLGLGRAVSRIAKEQAAITPEVSGPIGNDRPRVLGRIAGRIPSGAGGRGAPEAVARSKVGDTDTLYQDSALANGQPLFQQQRDQQGTIQAWTHFVSASKAIIGATDQADVSSFFHEFGHPMRRFLFNRNVPQEQRGNITDEDIRKIEDFVGVKDGKWTVENEERFVDALMSYWMEGKAPTKQLETIFQKISAWLSDVLSVIARKVDLTPEVRAIFDKVHQRGGVDPKKLQALSEAEVSKKSKVETAPKAAPDEAIDDSLDDFFGDIAPSEERVEALAKIKDAGIKIKQTAKGWSVTGLPNNLSWEMRDGIKAEGGRSTDYGYFFKDNPTSRLVGTAEEIIRESQLAAEAAEKGLVRTRIGDLEPAAAEWYENERAQRIGVLQATRSEAIQRVTDALVVSPKNRGMFAIKMKRAAENDYDSIVGFDEMAGLAGVSEQELFELLQKHKPASDREIEEQVDNELASLLYNASEQVEDDLSVEDGDISFDFGAPSEPAQPQQSAIEGLEDDVARLERKDIHKAKSDKFRNQLEGDSSKGKQSSFLSDIYGDKYDPTQGTLFDVDGIAENDTDTLFQAMESPERQAARILKSAIEAGATTFEDYIAHAREQLREDQLLQNASTMERTWDRLRARDGFTHLGPVGKVSDILSAKPEPSKKPKQKTKQPPKPPEQELPGQPETTGTKHAKTDELRAKRGFPERVPPEPETFQEWEDEARRKYPGAADRLRVIDLAEQHPERVGKIENAAIGQHIVYLENLHKSGEDVLDELLRTIKVANVVGSEAGRALVSRKAERFSDFSLAGIVDQHIATVGKDPTDEQMQKYAELADKVTKLEGDLDVLKKKLAKAEVEKSIAEAAAAKDPPPPKRGTKKATLLKKASAAVAAFKAEWATLSQLGAVNDPRQQADKWIKITKAAGEVIKSYAELGVVSFLELISSVKRDMGQLDQYQVDAFKEAWGTHKKATKSEPLGENPKDAAIGALARDLTRWAVESGIEGREEVIDAVHQELQDMGLDISRSDTMAAMSGYGDFRELSKDEVSVKVRGIKGEIQQLLKLEDMQAGQAPMKTGVERREPTPEERQLIKQVNEAKKRGGYEVTDPDRQLKSALGTAKTAIRNRIADLEQEIQSREKIVKERTPLKEDGELLSLREKRDLLLKEHRKIFPPKNSGLTDAQRLKMAEALLDRQIAELTADLAAGRLEPKDKRAQVTSTALDAKKAAKKALIEARDSAREASPEYQAKLEAKRTAQYKKTLEKQLAFWQSRRDEASIGNLPEKRKPKTPVDNEILEKKWQIELVKREARAEIEHAERAARGPAQKALGFGGDLLDFARAIQTGYELSATLRQGAFYTLGFPRQAIPALLKSIEAAFSRRADFALHDDLLKRPNHLEYMAGKLETTAADGPLSHREEALRSRIASWLSQTEGWKWAIPRWAAEGLLGSERAFRSFSNTMRADLFDYMKASVDASRPGTWSEDDAKVVGGASNVFSGRAPMQHSVAWGRVLYAPRWVWSRALLAVGQPAWKGDKATRLAVGKVYVRAALGMAAFQAIKHLIYLLSADDDDDKPKYELDMRSSDFGKMRIGDTRLDTGAGVNQLATLAARLATGQTKRQSGEIVDLRGDNVPYGADDTVDVMSRFLRTKLAPLPSGVIDWIAGENVVGEKSTVSKIIGDRLTPMTWGDIWDAEKALNVPQGTVAAIEAFLGTGVSTYGDKTKYRSASNEERTKILEKDLKNVDWDSPAPAYAEFLTEDQLKQFDDRKHYRFGSKVNDATGKPESESSIKARDEAIAVIKSSGWTYDESKKAMIDYWEATNTTKNAKGKEVKGKATEIKNGNSVYKDAVQKRITILRKIYQTK